MQRYQYDHDAHSGEREPLDNRNYYNSPSHQQSSHSQQYGYQQPQNEYPPQQEYQDPYQSPPRRPAQPRVTPRGAHPDSAFNRLRAERRYSRDQSVVGGGPAPYAGVAGVAAVASSSRGNHQEAVSPIATSAPLPPPHRDADGRYWGHELGYAPNDGSVITPGADNFSDRALGGGMPGIAYGVAERNARESGMEAMRGTGQSQPSPPRQPFREPTVPQLPMQTYNQQPTHGSSSGGGGRAYDGHGYDGQHGMDRQSDSSLTPLGAAAVQPGRRSPSRGPYGLGAGDVYSDDPYQGYSRGSDHHLGAVNPSEIEDDGDDGLVYRKPARTSMLSLNSDRGKPHKGAAAGVGVAGGVAAGGVIGTLGGLVGRQGHGSGGSSGNYGPVNAHYNGAGGSDIDLGGHEKPSEWLSKQKSTKKKWTILIVVAALIVVAGAVAVGVYFGVFKKNNGSGGGGQSAADDSKNNGDLNINSPEIQGLLNNKDLHKVFPGMDYTPLNTQYPECLNPNAMPSQNNITRDVAVLSQLTNTIRLYGTDCNQTEMVLHAIDRLGMNDTLKVWLGVWQDKNATTNERQLSQMWEILDKYKAAPFKGIIVANEILFREQMTVTQLGTLLQDVRDKLKLRGITNLPVATSDLGNKWTWELAQKSDYIMANIHPFFGGVNAKEAASWTNTFWTTQNGPIFKADKSHNVISETGWPSQGGTHCDSTAVTVCPNAAVAGISQLNQFMADWVCQALTNGTNYFWFSAFDEPWKATFNTPGSQEWEDHWGLLDVNRKVKDGMKIPDCGGKTV